MLVFHLILSDRVSTIKLMLFYYRHISMFVSFHVSLCSLLLSCMFKLTALCAGVKTLYNTITNTRLPRQIITNDE